MAIAPPHPRRTVECNVCGNTGPGDCGFCPSCGHGKHTIPRYTYLPLAHINQSDDDTLTDWSPADHTTKSNGERTKQNT